MWKLMGVGTVALGLMTGCYLDVGDGHGHGNDVDWQTESRALSGFTRVESHAPLEVVVLEGPESRVQVSTDPDLQDDVRTWVRGDTLFIDADGAASFQGAGLVTVTLPRFLGATLDGAGTLGVEAKTGGDDVSVVSRGAGVLRFCGPVHTLDAEQTGSGRMELCTSRETLVDAVTLRLSGSGSMTWSGLSRGVTVSNDGSGKLALSGSANHLGARLGGSGGLDGRELVASSADLVTEGSGNVQARVDGGGVNVTIDGSGDVELWGNASTQTVRVHGSGKLVRH